MRNTKQIHKLAAEFSCRIQQLMLSNTIVKLSAVFLFATPAVLIGGELYALLTGGTPAEGFLKIYSVLYIIPGTPRPPPFPPPHLVNSPF